MVAAVMSEFSMSGINKNMSIRVYSKSTPMQIMGIDYTHTQQYI